MFTSRQILQCAAVALVVSVVLAYSGSINAPFVFDDIPGVVRNTTIRELWPPWSALNPAVDGSGVSGRPLVNLSLAVNYAAGALDVRGYHLTNLAFHTLAALTLWGLLRRTARRHWGAFVSRNYSKQPGPRNCVGTENSPLPVNAELFAWVTTLLWALHPLLTESVVCVIQRNEVLSSLFYLLTMYCFVRAVDCREEAQSGAIKRQRNKFRWFTLSSLSCIAGVASKETVATAPLLIFLYDRTFVSGSFREAWRCRKKYYGSLAGAWLMLACLVWHNRFRGGTAGFGLSVSSWEYLLTQCRAVTLYLKLAFWPTPLVLDYGWPVVRSLREIWWQALILVGLLVVGVTAFWRKPAAGFLTVSFFILLAPSSSFVPLSTQTIAEHRMYLPLAVVLGLVVGAILTTAGHVGIKSRNVAVIVLLATAVTLGISTMKRNGDYRTELSIWTDTVAKCPLNARAQGNLGRAYLLLGQWEQAIAASREELRIGLKYNGDGRANLARALTELGRSSEALPYFAESLRLKPDEFDVHNNYGIALASLGQLDAADQQYREAIRLDPGFPDAHNNLANVLVKLERRDEAISHYATALRLRPDFAEAAANLGRTLVEMGRAAEALLYLERAAQLRPNSPDIHEDMGKALAITGQLPSSVIHYEEALRLQPGSVRAQLAIGNVFAAEGKFAEAIRHFEIAVRLRPDSAEAHHNLATALMKNDQQIEALSHFEATAHLVPGSADAQHELALVLGELHRWNEAMRYEEEALRLNPDLAEAKTHLDWLRERN